MKNLFFCSIIFILLTRQAFSLPTQEIITCNQNANALSMQFEQHWERTPKNTYISNVNDDFAQHHFTGTLNVLESTLPRDKNPHLHFMNVVLKKISHYQLWNIDCLYCIKNPDIYDLDNHYLHMSTSMDLHDYDCKQSSRTSIICHSRAK